MDAHTRLSFRPLGQSRLASASALRGTARAIQHWVRRGKCNFWRIRSQRAGEFIEVVRGKLDATAELTIIRSDRTAQRDFALDPVAGESATSALEPPLSRVETVACLRALEWLSRSMTAVEAPGRRGATKAHTACM
jgi:hypothetical protein